MIPIYIPYTFLSGDAINEIDRLVNNTPSTGISIGINAYKLSKVSLGINILSKYILNPWVYARTEVIVKSIVMLQNEAIIAVKEENESLNYRLSDADVITSLACNENWKREQEWLPAAWTNTFVTLSKNPFKDYKKVSIDGKIFLEHQQSTVKEMTLEAYLNALNDDDWKAAFDTAYASGMLYHGAATIRQMAKIG